MDYDCSEVRSNCGRRACNYLLADRKTSASLGYKVMSEFWRIGLEFGGIAVLWFIACNVIWHYLSR